MEGYHTGLTAGNVSGVVASSGQYPASGNYTVTTQERVATGTGTNAVVIPGAGAMTGSLSINGTAVNLTTYNAGAGVKSVADLVAAINAAAPPGVTASAGGAGTKLVLTDTAASGGTDITVDDSGVTAGSIGWTTADKTNSGLLGASLSLALGATTWSANVSAAGGTLTNFTGTVAGAQASGLDVTYGTVTNTAAQAQTFTLGGFDNTSLAKASATSNYSTSVTVYDSLGQSHVVNFYFRKAAGAGTGAQQSTWEWHAMLTASDSATNADTEVGTGGTLTFNQSGVLTAGGSTMNLPFNFSQGASPGQSIGIVLGTARAAAPRRSTP